MSIYWASLSAQAYLVVVLLSAQCLNLTMLKDLSETIYQTLQRLMRNPAAGEIVKQGFEALLKSFKL